MSAEFSNTVRVLAVGDEQSLIRFCEESGTIERILAFKHSVDIGDSILFVRFEKVSYVYDLKRRARATRLGGRSVLVETLSDSPILQEQCKKICRASEDSFLSPSLFTRRSMTPLGKENRLAISDRPTSVPTNRPPPMPRIRLSSDGICSGAHRSSPFRRLDPHGVVALRNLGVKSTSADESVVSTLTELPSPLARSPTIFRTSVRSNSFRTPRASIFTPLGSATRATQSPLLGRTLPLPQRPESARAHYSTEIRGGSIPEASSSFISDLNQLKQELAEAKEKYARSLEKVQSHLELMEKKYKTHQILERS